MEQLRTPALAGIAHRLVRIDDRADLHIATAGDAGSPVLLVHGFPETWWAFHRVIPLLAERHRVVAVDLPGFGDSPFEVERSGAEIADLLAVLVEELGHGPVHLVGQDISGPLTYRLAACRPDLVRTYASIETVLPGFGWEALADVAHGGAWYIGLLAAPGVPELLLGGRERELFARHVLGPQTRVAGVPSEQDLDVLADAYSGPDGFRAAGAVYRSLLGEGPEIQALAARALSVPVLAVSGSAGDFVPTSLLGAAPDLAHVHIPDVGHYVALEAPAELASALVRFFARS